LRRNGFIAGHSLGGWVAQEVAARAPERVSKLFLCDTWARKPQGTDEYLRTTTGRTPSAIWMAR
jgi:pimeloyl-ACP methyl ester carboxylesterase